MLTRRAILISNPKTGRYESQRTSLESFSNQLRSAGIELTHISTSGPGDATRIAARAATDGFTEILVSGGDGTINEALQGMIGTNTCLGILPRGTANVLAIELKLPLNVEKACEVIGRGNKRRIHIGCAIDYESNTKRHFFLMAGIGLDASVVSRVRPELKKRFGKAAFWYSGFSHLAKWEAKPFTMEIDGQTYTPTYAAIGNAASYGGDLSVTPRARIDAPEFEVCMIDSQNRFRYLSLLPYVVGKGIPESARGVRFIKTTRVRATGNSAVQLDGELAGKLPMTFEIAPHSIEVFVP